MSCTSPLFLSFFLICCSRDRYFVSGVELLVKDSKISSNNVCTEKKDSSFELLLTSGLKIAFSDAKASPILIGWVNELDAAGGSVSQYHAVTREQEVPKESYFL